MNRAVIAGGLAVGCYALGLAAGAIGLALRAGDAVAFVMALVAVVGLYVYARAPVFGTRAPRIGDDAHWWRVVARLAILLWLVASIPVLVLSPEAIPALVVIVGLPFALILNVAYDWHGAEPLRDRIRGRLW